MARGVDVLVELDVDVAPVAIHGTEPHGIAEGEGDLFRLVVSRHGFLFPALHLVQAAYAVVRGIQRQRLVRALSQLPHLLQIEEHGVWVSLMKFDVQVFGGLQPVLNRACLVVPVLNQGRQFLLGQGWGQPKKGQQPEVERNHGQAGRFHSQ